MTQNGPNDPNEHLRTIALQFSFRWIVQLHYNTNIIRIDLDQTYLNLSRNYKHSNAHLDINSKIYSHIGYPCLNFPKQLKGDKIVYSVLSSRGKEATHHQYEYQSHIHISLVTLSRNLFRLPSLSSKPSCSIISIFFNEWRQQFTGSEG